MKLQLVVVDPSATEYTKKIPEFRSNASAIGGKIRSPAEQAIHNDKYSSDKDIQKYVFILESDEIVGMTAVFARHINFENHDILMGGIGRVRVRDDRRKKGLATIMMTEAMQQLRLVKADVALLCTDLDSFLMAFYGKYGFQAMNKPYTYVSKSGRKYTENNGMLATIASKKIFEEIMESSLPLDIGVGNW